MIGRPVREPRTRCFLEVFGRIEGGFGMRIF
jgi:hypothetical protein